jgi:hypothetical protein
MVLSSGSQPASARTEAIELVRIPESGLQPDVAMDRSGLVHMVYLAGEPGAANVFYARSRDSGETFSSPIRVNSQDNSAIAAGTIRGAQVALGRNGRVHVAWNGSGKAEPQGPSNPLTKRPGAPMLYARSNQAGTAFEPQRNLITRTTDLDGGGSIAADDRGRVYVAWHGGPADGAGGESARRVWIARSLDDGTTFGRENPVSDPETGICGCCALRLFAAPDGALHVVYRSATNKVHRDIYSLVSRDQAATFTGARLHQWEIGACPMTSMSIAAGPRLLAAWETDGQVYFSGISSPDKVTPPPGPAPADHARRKHPRLAAGQNGTVLLVWTEGMSSGRGGSLGWQTFSLDGAPTATKGTQQGIPASSFAAVVPRADGGFTILY